MIVFNLYPIALMKILYMFVYFVKNALFIIKSETLARFPNLANVQVIVNFTIISMNILFSNKIAIFCKIMHPFCRLTRHYVLK